MKNMKQHILVAFAVIMTLLASCSKDEAKVIPRKKMAEIYAEMLVMDQWIISTSGVRRIADTSLVYEPILNKYGYDSEDYRKSIDVYMDDPERFSRILRTTGEILEAQIAELKIEQERLDALAKIPKIESDFKVGDYVPYWNDEYYVHYHDSLDIALDSATRMYLLKSIERGDTLYDGIRIVLPGAEIKKDTVDTLKPVLEPKMQPLLNRARMDSIFAKRQRPKLNIE